MRDLKPVSQPLALETTRFPEMRSMGLTYQHSLRQFPATHFNSWSPKLENGNDLRHRTVTRKNILYTQCIAQRPEHSTLWCALICRDYY